jgi:hypothetical protein
VPQAFVVTVEELESGINKSRFGAIRTFKLDRTTLRIEIQGSRLGEGVGGCKNCKNIQELTVDFAFGSKSATRSQQQSEVSLSAVAVPTDWHKVEAGPFSLFAPLGWEFHQLTGVDSYVGEFVGDGAVLKFDFGRYSSSLKEAKEPTYVIAHESIGGLPAKIVSPRTPGHGVTGIYLRKVRGPNALCLWGRDLTSAQQELVLKIFGTIRFGGTVPRYVFPPPPPPPKNAQ